jgi:hypothetical protein
MAYMRYLPGKPVFIERTISQMGFLPDAPGTYSMVAVWRPSTGTLIDDYPGAKDMRTYAVAESAPATFHVVDSAHPKLPAPVPRCVATPAGFEQVETTLGPKTALKDNLTGLLWLHLTASQTLGYQGIQKALAEGGKLAGWRYATLEELRQFFIDYVGSPDGTSADAAMAARFLDDIDGTTAILDIPETSGHVMYGHISDANPGTGKAEITPSRFGWASEGSTTPAWLVRETTVLSRQNP